MVTILGIFFFQRVAHLDHWRAFRGATMCKHVMCRVPTCTSVVQMAGYGYRGYGNADRTQSTLDLWRHRDYFGLECGRNQFFAFIRLEFVGASRCDTHKKMCAVDGPLSLSTHLAKRPHLSVCGIHFNISLERICIQIGKEWKKKRHRALPHRRLGVHGRDRQRQLCRQCA